MYDSHELIRMSQIVPTEIADLILRAMRIIPNPHHEPIREMSSHGIVLGSGALGIASIVMGDTGSGFILKPILFFDDPWMGVATEVAQFWQSQGCVNRSHSLWKEQLAKNTIHGHSADIIIIDDPHGT